MKQSQLLADALAALVAHEREREDVARYVKGYSDHPETEEDVIISDDLLSRVLEEEDRESRQT